MGSPVSRVIQACPNVEKKRISQKFKSLPNPGNRSYSDNQLWVEILGNLNSMRHSGSMVDLVIVNGEHSYPCHSVVMCARSKYFHDLVEASVETTNGTICFNSPVHLKVCEIENNIALKLLEYIYTGCISIPFQHSKEFVEASVKWKVNDYIEFHEKVSLSQYYSRRSSSVLFHSVFSDEELRDLSINIQETDIIIMMRFSEYFSVPKNTMLTSNFVVMPLSGKGVHCHREVLVSCSDYFRCMLSTCSFKESKQDCVQLQDIDHATLRLIIQYFYTSKVHFTSSNAAQIAKATGWLCPHLNIYNEASNYLMACLSCDNCFEMEQLGRDYALHELHTAAMDFILNNMWHLTDTEQFLNLHEEILRVYLSSDALQAMQEKQVFLAIIKWGVRHGVNSMLNLISETVRISLMNLSELEECLTLVSSLSFLERKLLEDKFKIALRNINISPIEERLKFSRQRHRSCSTETVVLISSTNMELELHSLYQANQIGEDSSRFTILNNSQTLLNSSCSHCCSVLPMDNSYKRRACAVFDNKLFLTGGIYGGCTTISDTYIYLPKEHKWLQGPSLNDARHSHNMLAVGDSLYVIGGPYCKRKKGSGKTLLKTVERLRMSGKSWEKVPSLPADDKVINTVSAALGSKIYVFCSHENSSHTSVYRYSTKEQDWLPPLTLYSPLPFPVHFVATYEDTIYAFSNQGTRYKVLPFNIKASPRWGRCVGSVKTGCCPPMFHSGKLVTVEADYNGHSWSVSVQTLEEALLQVQNDEPTPFTQRPTSFNIQMLHTYFPC
ncbi:kelch-like protein 26 [Ciona intestinalis]